MSLSRPIWIFLLLLSLSLPSLGQGEETADKHWGEEVKGVLDSIRLKDRWKNTKQGVVIASLEAKARRQESRGDLEEATLLYLKVVDAYREIGDSLGIARTYNKVAGLYIQRGNQLAARRYLALAAIASGENPAGEPPASPLSPDSENVDFQPKTQDEDTASEEENTNTPTSGIEPSRPRYSPPVGLAGNQDRLLSQLEAIRDSSAMLRLMIADQEKNILLLEQEKELAYERRQRQKRFQYTLLAGVVAALLLALLLYRQFRIKRNAHLKTAAALRQLAEAHEQLKAAQTQLVESEKMASLGLLTAGIAHEINNPINFISGNIEPLKQDIADILEKIEGGKGSTQDGKWTAENEKELAYLREEVQELLAGIEEGAGRTTEIVKGLREFSRLDTADLQEFDIHAGIESTLLLLKNELGDHIEVEKSYGELPLMEGYPGKLNQVLMNVLTNAIQAMPEGGTLGIITSLDEKSERIRITILDNGKGIAEAILGKVFDPFFTTKEVGEGTGLGLAISKGIIDQHQGEIRIRSEINVGTEVIMSLPVRQPKDIS